MKIRRITATPINFPLEALYGWVFGELPGFTQTIVEVQTDDGLVGLGEASGAGAATFINDSFAPRLVGLDETHGVAVLSVGNSYACGSLGYFVEQLAGAGLVALMAANASPSIAPWGGTAAFFGTNPLAGCSNATAPKVLRAQAMNLFFWSQHRDCIFAHVHLQPSAA